MNPALRATTLCALVGSTLLFDGCQHAPGKAVRRKGDEIIVAGQLFHTGTRVITWMDPGGYDAYRVERRFSPLEESDWETTKAKVEGMTTPNRYGLRKGALPPVELERLRGGGWDLATLRGVVDQFVLHYDVCGVSKVCFDVLHDHRDLSVHFMLDIDGTIYQTLDLKERARHATIANDRSIGVEIANIGAYPPNDTKALDEWYARDAENKPYLRVPEKIGDPLIRTKNFTGHPARAAAVRGTIQGVELLQYDFTPEQYDALIKLTASLCRIFPKLKCDYPRDAAGQLVPQKLSDEALAKYQGVLGHFHIQTNKTDPGPALQWDKIIDGARRLLP